MLFLLLWFINLFQSHDDWVSTGIKHSEKRGHWIFNNKSNRTQGWVLGTARVLFPFTLWPSPNPLKRHHQFEFQSVKKNLQVVSTLPELICKVTSWFSSFKSLRALPQEMHPLITAKLRDRWRELIFFIYEWKHTFKWFRLIKLCT